MTKLGKFILVIFILAAVTVGYFAFRSNGNSGPNAPIKIGFVGPLTGSSYPIGEPIMRSMTLAIDELKAKDPRYTLVTADDACDSKQAAIAMQKLIDVDQVKFFVGGVCNDESMALAQVAETNHVILISPAVSIAAFSHTGDYVFRNTQPDILGGTELGSEAAKHFKMVAVMSEQADEATAYQNAFNDALVAGGGTVTGDDTAIPGTIDFTKEIDRLRGLRPQAQALFINLRSDASVTAFLDELVKSNWKIPLYVYPNIAGKASIAKYAKLLEGATAESAPSLDPTNSLVVAFKAAYEKAYGQFVGVDAYNAAGYEAVQLVAQGIASGSNTPDAMAKYLMSVRNYVGIQGTYSFDENGDLFGIPFNLQTVKNGKLVPVTK